MIIVDTREQKPLWDPAFFNVKSQKLDEGDYTTEELLGVAHIERKSGCDLYGSIIQGHSRFRAELQRAIDKKIKLAVFVECTKSDFMRKKFKGGHRLRAPQSTLAKIILTISLKYHVDFYWCNGRDDLRDKMCNWFVNQLEKVDDPEQLKIARKNLVGFKNAAENIKNKNYTQTLNNKAEAMAGSKDRPPHISGDKSGCWDGKEDA